ncbi:hypothetical protein [Streptomyces sp. NPDC058268]|uniref:hypothetical protein n=1 Tax=Streptomyces sp. NPDC058268 TaxID=3346413 RepID=UPI0036E21986
MASPDSEFFTRASEAAFDLGLDGFRVSAIAVQPRQVTFTATDGPVDPPVYAEGEPPVPGRAGRREHDWQPAANAPSWMNMAWLLEDMATWITPLAQDHVLMLGIQSASHDWCDVLLRDSEDRYRVRIGLARRRELLDFPGMYLRDMFAEGRQHQYLSPEVQQDEQVVDLRNIL